MAHTIRASNQAREDTDCQSYLPKTAPTSPLQPLELESLDQFKYTEAVLNEALRLFPPGAVFAREVRRPLARVRVISTQTKQIHSPSECLSMIIHAHPCAFT